MKFCFSEVSSPVIEEGKKFENSLSLCLHTCTSGGNYSGSVLVLLSHYTKYLCDQNENFLMNFLVSVV
jgi:hypothetical protein